MEKFRNIKGFDGIYQISNYGRVKSHHGRQERIFTPQKTNSGYFQVMTSVGGKVKIISIHREVARAFIKNIKNKECVNHINGIKSDNRAENLEWCTYSENMDHAFKAGLMNHSRKQRDILIKRNSKVVVDSSTGIFFDNCKEAAKTFNFNYSTLRSMLNGNNPNRTHLMYL